jgi:enoyl-CoA hydratase/carnithine racemase
MMSPSASASPAAQGGQPLVLSTVRAGVATLALNNPAKRNALSSQMLLALGGIAAHRG